MKKILLKNSFDELICQMGFGHGSFLFTAMGLDESFASTKTFALSPPLKIFCLIRYSKSIYIAKGTYYI